MKKLIFLIVLMTGFTVFSCEKEEAEPPIQVVQEDPDLHLLDGILLSRSGPAFVFYDSSLTFRFILPYVTSEIQLNGTFIDRIVLVSNGGDAVIDDIYHYQYDMIIYWNNGQISFAIPAYAEYATFGEGYTLYPSSYHSLPIPLNKYSITRTSVSRPIIDYQCNRQKNEFLYRIHETMADTFLTKTEYLRPANCSSNFYRLKFLRRS